MRASSSFRVLTFGAALASSGCLGPFASLSPRAATPVDSTTAPVSADREERAMPSPPTEADAAPGSDCGDAKALGDDGAELEHTTLDDGFEGPPPVTSGGAPASTPFAELSDGEIAARLRADIGAFGPMAIGRPHGGVLIAGLRMPEGANWQLVNPGLAWGTKEAVDALSQAIDAVATRFPNTPPAFIGDISARHGGHLHPHVSHQSGRDVDLSYYLTEGHRWYATANGSNLDRARTWHLIRTLIAESDVDLILVDLQIQRILKAYALEIGEDAGWLDQIFQVGGKSKRPLIFHAKGHATHLHVRFYSPVAQELGRRAYRFLVARRLISPPTLFITHTVKAGETLSHLALRYKVTTDAIKKANGLTRDVLRVSKSYKVPQTGGIAMPQRAVVPVRPVPPTPSVAARRRPAWGGEPCLRASSGDSLERVEATPR